MNLKFVVTLAKKDKKKKKKGKAKAAAGADDEEDLDALLAEFGDKKSATPADKPSAEDQTTEAAAAAPADDVSV